MAKNSINLQDSFLNQVRKDNVEIQLVLLDGSTLVGHVRGFDNFTVIVNGPQAQHLIYKHAIAHVVSQRRVTDGEHSGQREHRGGEHHRSHDNRNQDNRGGENRGGDHRGPDNRSQDNRAQGRPPRDARPPQQAPRPPREADASAEKTGPKFNSLDLSSVQIDGETK